MMGSPLSAELEDSQMASLERIIDDKSLTTPDEIIKTIMELEPDPVVLAEMVAQLKLRSDIMELFAKGQAITLERNRENSGSFDP